MFREFIQYYKPHKKVFIQDLMAAFLVAVIDLVYPVVTRNMLNVYIPNQMLSSLLTSTAVLLILYLVLRPPGGRGNAGRYAPGCVPAPAKAALLLF